jgi:hypothetical protein
MKFTLPVSAEGRDRGDEEGCSRGDIPPNQVSTSLIAPGESRHGTEAFRTRTIKPGCSDPLRGARAWNGSFGSGTEHNTDEVA